MRRSTALVVTFVASAALSLLAASHRFGDSAHAMGVISQRGGKARHPVHLPAGRDRYTLVVTATVLPPFRGDVTVAVDGDPAPRFAVYPSEPVVDLGVVRRPHFLQGAFRGVQPGDRIALWLRITPPEVDPVCGRAVATGFVEADHDGRTYHFCSAACRDTFMANPDRPAARGVLEGAYRVVFRDAAIGRPVLEIPLTFGGGGGGGHEG